MDVNINEENTVKKLKVNLNDDPKIIAYEFCKKYGKIISYFIYHIKNENNFLFF